MRRECRRASAVPVCSCAHLSPTLHTRPRVQQAPGIPCSLSFEGKVHANLGRNASREREHTFSRHRPRRRTIQYSRGVSDRIEKPQRTGYPACAGYDDRVQRCDLYVIASAAKQSSLSLCREVDCFAALAMTRIGRGALDTPHVWDIASCSSRTKSSSGRRSGFRRPQSRPCENAFSSPN